MGLVEAVAALRQQEDREIHQLQAHHKEITVELLVLTEAVVAEVRLVLVRPQLVLHLPVIRWVAMAVREPPRQFPVHP